MAATNQYHETSSDQSDYGEDDEESESSSGADGEAYGEEEDESQESSFTDYQPSEKVVQHYGAPYLGQQQQQQQQQQQP